MPIVATHGLVVIARDKRIRRKPGEIATYRAHGLRAFGLAAKRDLTTWGYLELVVRHWSRMQAVIATRPVGPWYFTVMEGGLTELKL